ncbi:MAG: hypothetical protein R3E77_02800 [Steroidobacteraceae bacterium]
MKSLLIFVLALLAGIIATRWWLERSAAQAQDPVRIMVTEIRTQGIIEHERSIAVWYRACPEVPGINPELFVAWPAKLSFELPLDDIEIIRAPEGLEVRTSAPRMDEPQLPTDFLDYLASTSVLSITNEQELINRETAKASPVARYLASYFLTRDPKLRDDMASELRALVARLSGALGIAADNITVTIPASEARLPPLPALELCEGTVAAVNGTPFARLEDGQLVPVALRDKPRGVIGGWTRTRP